MKSIINLPFIKYSPLLVFTLVGLFTVVKDKNNVLTTGVLALLILLTIFNAVVLIPQWKVRKDEGKNNHKFVLLGIGLAGCILIFLVQLF